MQIHKARLSLLMFLFAISACAENPIEARQRWVYWSDRTVADHENIKGFIISTSGVALEDVKEVRPGVMEYYFRDKRIFTGDKERCRFVYVVETNTGTVIGWRYNGNPEYCVQVR